MRLRSWFLIIMVVGAGVLAAVWYARHADPARQAVAEFLQPPVGVEANYPKLGFVLRSRCWLLSGPAQPEGSGLFVSLPDAVYGPERVISAHELRPSFALISGKIWDAKRNGWLGTGDSFVSLAGLRESLEAACPHPGDARLILDLLTGQPAQAVSSPVGRLRRGDLPDAFRIRPFSGTQGVMLSDPGRAPYKESVRGYKGLVLRLDGADWPTYWRLGSLQPVGF